jgi:phage baseplate assembly protein W
MPRYDVHIQLAPEAAVHGGGFYGFGDVRSIGIRGVQKLVNMFAKYLLTPIGSDPTDLDYGTDLPNLMGSNVDVYDAKEVLELSVAKTVQAIQSYQASAEIPDEERLSTATVTDYIVITDTPGISAQIYIENTMNQGIKIILPSLQVGSL